MTVREILNLRLSNQCISGKNLSTPENTVSWLGAVQAQDYAGAKWSIALRLKNSKESDIDKAIASRSIVRTWPMRGTLHFISAADVRWMLKLLSPKIIAGMAGRNRQLELSESVFDKCADLLTAGMEGGKQLMRSEVYAILEKNGVAATGQRGIHIINYLAQKQIICHGIHQGKQPTYALLDEWIPKSRELSGDEALAEIAIRYFQSHGPATVADFVWWTGLKLSDARTGINAISEKLTKHDVQGDTFWSVTEQLDLSSKNSVHLLPGFDEFMLGYTNRTLMVDQLQLPRIVPGNNGVFMPTIVINGKVEGLWKRSIQKEKIIIELTPFENLKKAHLDQIAIAARKFGRYHGREIVLSSY